jgi:hypothetical protein
MRTREVSVAALISSSLRTMWQTFPSYWYLSMLARFQVLTVAFYVVWPCSLLQVDRRLRSAYCLHHQGESQYAPLKHRSTSTILHRAISQSHQFVRACSFHTIFDGHVSICSHCMMNGSDSNTNLSLASLNYVFCEFVHCNNVPVKACMNLSGTNVPTYLSFNEKTLGCIKGASRCHSQSIIGQMNCL